MAEFSQRSKEEDLKNHAYVMAPYGFGKAVQEQGALYSHCTDWLARVKDALDPNYTLDI